MYSEIKSNEQIKSSLFFEAGINLLIKLFFISFEIVIFL